MGVLNWEFAGVWLSVHWIHGSRWAQDVGCHIFSVSCIFFFCNIFITFFWLVCVHVWASAHNHDTHVAPRDWLNSGLQAWCWGTPRTNFLGLLLFSFSVCHRGSNLGPHTFQASVRPLSSYLSSFRFYCFLFEKVFSKLPGLALKSLCSPGRPWGSERPASVFQVAELPGLDL